MYYDRTLSDEFASNLMEGGKLRWLFDFVKERSDLELSLVVSGQNGKKKERIIFYRGLTKIMEIEKMSTKQVKVKGAGKYREIVPDIYGEKDVEYIKKEPVEKIIKFLREDEKSARYYDSKKEGYYQNELSRKYGIDVGDDAEFVIVDKEVVVGYDDKAEREREFGPIKDKYKEIQKKILIKNPKRYGSKLDEKSLGNKLDFLALNKNGDIYLIELKHGTNTSGIYLSPLQIGLYYEIFDKFARLPNSQKDNKLSKLQKNVLSMLKQKQEIGLINPNWKVPKFSGKIVPVLTVADPNPRSSAKEKFAEILNICRENLGAEFLKNTKTFDYITDKDLVSWDR